jgi:hypothetical protein
MKIKPILPLISALVCLTVLLSYFGMFKELDFSVYFSSDCLYLPSIYKDLFIDGHSLNGWNFNPAPNFFPDMVFYFLLMAITNDFITASFLFSIIQFFVIIWLFYKLTLFFKRGDNVLTISFLFLLFPLFLYVYFHHGIYYSFIVLTNAYHNGAFIMALIALLFSFLFIKQNRYAYLFAVFFTGILAIVSDKLFVIYFIVPFSLALIAILIANRNLRYFKLLGVNIAIVLIGFLFLYIIKKNSSFFIEQTFFRLTFKDIAFSWSIFSEQLLNYLKAFSMMQIILMLSLISYFVTIYYSISGFLLIYRKQQELNLFITYQIFVLFAIPIIFLSPVLMGYYLGPDCFRYVIISLFLLILNLSVYLSQLKKINMILWSFLFVVHVAILSNIFSNYNIYQGLKNYFNYYPQEVKNIDAIADKYGLKYGTAKNWWSAKHITMFSKKEVHVYHVFDGLTANHHVCNQNWFYGFKKGKFPQPLFTFFICGQPGETPGFVGEDTLSFKRITEGSVEFLLFDPFKYDESTCRPIYHSPDSVLTQ